MGSKQQDATSKVNRIREIVRNTEENLKEAEFSKEFADEVQRDSISGKNERRKHEIEELKEEIKKDKA